MYFRNYRLSKTRLVNSLKSAVPEHPSTVNMLKGSKHLWNLHETTFIIFFHYSEGEIIWKASPLLKFEMIGVFVKTWTADYKYPLSDFANFSFPIQMKLSEQSKRISQFFVQLMESTFNLSIFKKTILS